MHGMMYGCMYEEGFISEGNEFSIGREGCLYRDKKSLLELNNPKFTRNLMDELIPTFGFINSMM